ncbi:MAG: LysE/ArgO family amino acid transporter [Desulfovibrionaceae bacterium]
MLPIYLKGLVIGFSIAAPVGPIGVLCMQRSLERGRVVGLATGMGAAAADAVYGFVAAFGLAAFSAALVSGGGWLRGVGGLFLLWLGVRIFRSRPADKAACVAGGESNGTRRMDVLLRAFASTFVLTLTNPMTILSFAAIFAGLGVGTGATRWESVTLVAGVFCGSAAWWLTLSTTAGLLRHRLAARLVLVNRVCGAVVAAFGVASLASLASLL